jgi:nitronate monooxygenase
MERIKKLPSLIIGDLEINPPFIQGGMGVRISKANLVAAVANEGCVGVISAIGLGPFEERKIGDFVNLNERALRDEIRKARNLTDGIIGTNTLVACTNYSNLVLTAAQEKVDLIICGAGLPSDLPGIVAGHQSKLVPIVSSARVLNVICKKWKQYNKKPDAVILEGPKAGGHLGFDYDDIVNNKTRDLDEILKEVIALANSFEPHIPVIAAGGIFDGKDIARVLKLGAAGVQMATRFVCTNECDVHLNFKMAYINCKEEDITIIKSPVGMPGRVINNAFVEKIKRGETIPFKCSYKCLKTCDSKTAPYCIAKVLVRAAEGDFGEAFAFAGENAYRCKEIIPVKQLISELEEEACEALKK